MRDQRSHVLNWFQKPCSDFQNILFYTHFHLIDHQYNLYHLYQLKHELSLDVQGLH